MFNKDGFAGGEPSPEKPRMWKPTLEKCGQKSRGRERDCFDTEYGACDSCEHCGLRIDGSIDPAYLAVDE